MRAYLALAVLAGSFLGLTAGVSARPLTANCTSEGQLCDATIPLSFTVDDPRAEYGISLKAPASHCSEVRYIVFDPSQTRMGATQFLRAGESSYVSLGRNLARGQQRVFIGAEGKVGGCNRGRLASWGGEAYGGIIP